MKIANIVQEEAENPKKLICSLGFRQERKGE